MKQVILETARVGQGFMQEAGQTIEIEDREAVRLVKTGQARFLDQAVIETASIDHSKHETSSHPGRRRNRHGS